MYHKVDAAYPKARDDFGFDVFQTFPLSLNRAYAIIILHVYQMPNFAHMIEIRE